MAGEVLIMEKINKHTVLKHVRENNFWSGYIAPSNVNSYHITGGWHLGHDVLITIDQQKNYVVVNRYYDVENPMSWEWMYLGEYLDVFKYNNCHNELGKQVRFWN
jgi:hypothetical protein